MKNNNRANDAVLAIGGMYADGRVLTQRIGQRLEVRKWWFFFSFRRNFDYQFR